MAFRASAVSAGTSGSVTARAVVIPAEAVADTDEMVLIGVGYATGALFTAPTGQGAGSWVERHNAAYGSNTFTLGVWTKPVEAGDAGQTVNVTTSVSRNKIAAIVVHSATGFDAVSASASTQTSVTSVDGAAVTPAVANAQMLSIIAAYVDTVDTPSSQTTPPASFTERVDHTATNAGARRAGLIVSDFVSSGASSGSPYTPGSATLANASGVATITVSLSQPAVDVTVAVPAATSTGSAPAPAVSAVRNPTVPVPSASATASAPAPVVSAVRSPTVAVPPAQATASAPAPVVSTVRSPAIGVPAALATGSAPAPTVQTVRSPTVGIPAAVASASAPAPAVTAQRSPSIQIPAAGATAAMPAPTVVITADHEPITAGRAKLTVPAYGSTLTATRPAASITTPRFEAVIET